MKEMENDSVVQGKSRARRLGMGLSALLGGMDEIDFASLNEPAAEKGGALKNAGFVMLPIEKLYPNSEQPRRFFAEEELEELTQSIKKNGVLQPILVQKLEGDSYKIIAGERRYRASLKANLSLVPCIVRELSDEDAYVVAILENVQRQDLNPIEEAESYLKLMREFGYTQEEVANLASKSRSYVANTVRLAGLPEEVKLMLVEKKLTPGHARPILALSSAEQMVSVAGVIVDNDYTVRKVEEMVNLILNDEKALEEIEKQLEGIGGKGLEPGSMLQDSAHSEILNYLAEIEEKFTRAYKAPIKIKPSSGNAKKGMISIKYSSIDDLNLIMQKLVDFNS